MNKKYIFVFILFILSSFEQLTSMQLIDKKKKQPTHFCFRFKNIACNFPRKKIAALSSVLEKKMNSGESDAFLLDLKKENLSRKQADLLLFFFIGTRDSKLYREDLDTALYSFITKYKIVID
jgi:hypothetical protein